MSAIPVAVGVVGGFALVWLVTTLFRAVTAVVKLVETLVTFPMTPVHDR